MFSLLIMMSDFERGPHGFPWSCVSPYSTSCVPCSWRVAVQGRSCAIFQARYVLHAARPRSDFASGKRDLPSEGGREILWFLRSSARELRSPHVRCDAHSKLAENAWHTEKSAEKSTREVGLVADSGKRIAAAELSGPSLPSPALASAHLWRKCGGRVP